MESVVEVLGLDRLAFREWVSGERSRLPGSSDGFASFLAVLRMLRPVEVVWVSDGREPEHCGYDTSSVGRLILEVMSVGSRLVWSRVESGTGVISHEFSGLGGSLVNSSFTVVCIPEGYGVELHGGAGSLVVSRSVGSWDFSWYSGEFSSDSGSSWAVSDGSSYLSDVVVDGDEHDGGHSGDTSVGGVDDGGDRGSEPVGSDTRASRKRGKARRSGGD